MEGESINMQKSFDKMKISKKLTVAFAIIILITLVVSIIGIIDIISIKNADSKLYQEYTRGLQYAGNAAVTFQQLRYDNLKMDKLMSGGGSQDDVNLLVTSARDEIASIGDSFKKCESILVTKEFRDLLATIEDFWSQYSALMTKNLDYASKYDIESFAGNAAAAGSLGISVRDNCLALFEGLSQKASETSTGNASLATVGFIVMAIVSIIGIGISLMLAKALTANISNPIRKVALIADKVSEGNVQIDDLLDQKDFDINLRQDEIGALALSFNKLIAYIKDHIKTVQLLAGGDLTTKVAVRSDADALGSSLSDFIQNMNGLMATITTATEQVSTGAAQVANGAQALAAGSTEQASSIEELNASVTKIADQANVNSATVKAASGDVEQAVAYVKDSSMYMKQTQCGYHSFQ
jgi:methyl-accepting chemotaxis protein